MTVVGGPPQVQGGKQILGTGLRQAAMTVDVPVLMQLEFANATATTTTTSAPGPRQLFA